MIKWDGYGKLLKQSFFTLLISCFILLGSSFVKADGYTVSFNSVNQNGSYVSSIFDSNLELAVYGRGMLSTSKLGTTKRILAFQSFSTSSSQRRRYFWWNDGVPYYYFFSSLDGNTRAFSFDYYGLCDSVLTGGSSSVSNCVSSSVGSNFQTTFAGFFNSITSSDYWGYSYSDTALYPFNICFSSSSYGKTLCFRTSDGGTNITMDANLDFADFPNSLLGDPPGRSSSGGGDINGGSQQVNGGTITGNVAYSTCTNKNALAWYRRRGYNDNLCYSSYDNYTEIYQSGQTYGAFAIHGVDVEELRFNTASYRRYGSTGDGMSYTDWFQYWRKSRDVYKHSDGNINNPFVGVPVALFTYMGNINSYGMSYNNSSILEFCDLLLYRNESNPYTGLLSNEICNINIIDSLPDGYYVESGYNVVGSSWEGITNRTWNDGKPTVIPQRGTGYSTGESSSGNSSFTDGKTFENNYFNLLSDNFKFSSGGGAGALPGYIVLALCGIVLFRFLRH